MTTTGPATPPDANKIAYYGDSTVWGADGRTTPAPQYPLDNVPTLLQGLLRAVKLTQAAVVVNHGAPGLSSLPRLCGRAGTQTELHVATWAKEMAGPTGDEIVVYGLPPTAVPLGTDAKWVVNNTLINDIAVAHGMARPEDIESYYLAMAKGAADAGRRFVIETPNPVVALIPSNVTKFIRYVEAQRRAAIATNVPVIDQFRWIPHVLPDWGSHFSDTVEKKVHPDASLYRLKALISFWTFHELLTTDAPPKWDPPRAELIAAHAALNNTADAGRVGKAAAILVKVMPSLTPSPLAHNCTP